MTLMEETGVNMDKRSKSNQILDFLKPLNGAHHIP